MLRNPQLLNCFAKAGFATHFHPEDDDVDLAMDELEPPDGISAEDFHVFVDIDSSLECHVVLTDEDIVPQYVRILTPSQTARTRQVIMRIHYQFHQSQEM